ncbi:MAG: ribonuclease H-like domain-containing protein [Candidatus Woesearchaeota archaeon]
MLRNTFLFLPKVGLATEQKIWAQGVHDWNSFVEAKSIKGFSAGRKEQANAKIHEFKNELWNENLNYLAKSIPSSEHWRLYDHFRDDAVFLDIETNGYYGSITVVGLFDGNDTKTFIRGYNLDRRLIERELQKAKMIVTFNGSSFDLPVIERFFGLRLHKPHIDLRHVCSRIGLAGGLKAIEKQRGIKRGDDVEGISGSDAVYLWEQFRATKDTDYLNTLIRYNEEDIVNLRPLADYAVRELWVRTFINGNSSEKQR